MTTTVFTNGVTLTDAAWMNDVNNATYEGVGLAGFTVIASATTPDIFAATTSHVISYTGTATATSFATAVRAGESRVLSCTGAAVFTAGANLLIPGVASGANLTASANTQYDVTALTTTQFVLTPRLPIVRNAIAGLLLSTAGSSATMSIAAGQAADSTNVAMMSIAAFTKTTSAWAVGTGNGGLDTGAIATGTWYAFHLIMRVDTGVVDVLCSLSGTAPTMPTNYTLFRRIGWGLTNGSSQWTAFTQDGDFFQWVTTVGDIAANTPGTAAVTRTLTLPPQRVRAVLHVGMSGTATGNYAGLISDLSATDETPSTNGTFLGHFGVTAQTNGLMSSPVQLEVYSNSSKQVRSRVSGSDGNTNLVIRTRGWYDSRGKDA